MKIRVIEAFSDKQAGVDRKVGDLFDCPDERAKELIGYKLVEKVSGGKDELTEKDLDAKLKAIKDRETAVATREDAVLNAEQEVETREKAVKAKEEAVSKKEAELNKADSQPKKS